MTRNPAAISELARLFEQYRIHYGQVADARAAKAWVDETATSGELTFYGAADGPRMVGFAAIHQMPASLRLDRCWLLRDLYVEPSSRRQGIARRLVDTVHHAALDAGALRLSLQTEQGNVAALALYRRCGFTIHSDLTTLSLDLARYQCCPSARLEPAGWSENDTQMRRIVRLLTFVGPFAVCGKPRRAWLAATPVANVAVRTQCHAVTRHQKRAGAARLSATAVVVAVGLVIWTMVAAQWQWTLLIPAATVVATSAMSWLLAREDARHDEPFSVGDWFNLAITATVFVLVIGAALSGHSYMAVLYCVIAIATGFRLAISASFLIAYLSRTAASSS